MNIRMVLRTLGYVLGAESALLLLPLLTAALYRLVGEWVRRDPRLVKSAERKA